MARQTLEELSHKPAQRSGGFECVIEDWNVVTDCEGTGLPLLAEAHHNITSTKPRALVQFRQGYHTPARLCLSSCEDVAYKRLEG